MSSPWIPLNAPWQFDPISALVGVGAGLLAGAAATYRLRANIESAFQSVRNRAEHTRERLTMGTQQRYLEWLASRVSSLHLVREGAKLSELYIEPEFISPPPRPAVSNKPIEPPPTVSLSVVMKATPWLAVTGIPGSGRTALLAHIALTLGQAIYQNQTVWGLPEHTLPVYAHLGELALQAVEPAAAAPTAQPTPAKTSRPDPAQVLLDALAARMPILVQNSAPGLIRERLKNGQAVLLLDGLDELDAEAKSRALAWLKELLTACPKAHIVLTTAPIGYAPLIELGFTAIALAPWKATHVARLASRWMKAAQGSEQDAAQLASILKPVPGTSPLPIDILLAAFTWQKRGSAPPNRAAAYGQMVDILIEPIQAASPLSPLLARSVLARLALTLLTENRWSASRAEIEKAVTELLAPPTQAAPAPSPEATPSPSVEVAVTSAPTDQAQSPAAKPKEPPKPKGVPEAVEAVLKCGLLIERAKDQFVFAHRRLQANLAAWQITQTGSGAVLAQHLEDAEWSDVFEFCAGLVNVAPLVDVLIKRDASPSEGDLFHSRLWIVAHWAASAGPEAMWRGKVLAQVAGQFMQADQLPPLRERAMLALLSTQDKGLGYVFKQALASPVPGIRALAVRGLGLLGREQDLPTFESALEDPDESVRDEAVRSMAAVGGQASIEHLASVMLTADEGLRKTAALMLSENEAEGWRILKEAAHEEDMLVRRAAAFGLALTRQDWARDILTHLEREDSQWFVRSAATEAIASMKAAQEYALDCSPIVLDQQGWLVEWAAMRGIAVGLGHSAEPVLTRALNEGDLGVKLAVVHTLAHLARDTDIETLRAPWAAPEPELRDAAYQALQIIGNKMSIKIKRG